MGTILIDEEGLYLKRHAAGKGEISFTLAIFSCYHKLTQEEAIKIQKALSNGLTILEKSKT